VRFRLGCVRGSQCLIDQKEVATQTSDVVAARGSCRVPSVGTSLLTTPPTVSCTAINPLGNQFLIVASDGDCVPPNIALGPYVLANGEVIQLRVTDQPGVRLIGTSGNGIRRFQVGPGNALVTATDQTGNTTTARCR
jgi:hypothetical protein